MSDTPKKDNSEKACIHITQAQKLSVLNSLGIAPKKGVMPALIRALPKWAKENAKTAQTIAPFVMSQMPSTMSTGQKAARQLERTESPETVISDMLKALPPALRKQAEKELSKLSKESSKKDTE